MRLESVKQGNLREEVLRVGGLASTMALHWRSDCEQDAAPR
jgi:hypothetical protein